ncbi:MAG: alpha/beta fold hydrolase [Clostridia bacterium]|nr:alpha/beta fold hydrolase [Clostridia bacterium]
MLLYYCYREAFSTKGREFNIFKTPYGKEYLHIKEALKSLVAEVDAIPFEQVYTKSHDGLNLAARYYHVKDGAPLEIQFHGYRSSGLFDFCGGTKLAIRNGHNVLVIDQRGHGLSEGKHLTFGALEKYDCISWINYAIERFGADLKIFLLGASMGAATVLLASGLNLPPNVAGIIADSAYSSAEEIIKKVCEDRKLPAKISWPLVKKAAEVYMKCDLKDADVAFAVKSARVPILLIHGETDGFVPCEMSEEILKNAKDAERITFPNAGHVMSYMADPVKYEEMICEFMKKAEA